MKRWTIYSLTVEGEELPFYVGCTSRNDYRRWIEHKSGATKKSGGRHLEKDEIIRKAHAQEKKILVQKIEQRLSEMKALEREQFWISHFGRRTGGGSLVNRTDGGSGVKGIIMSAATRAQMASAKRGNKINLGRKRPDMLERFSKPITAYDETGEFVAAYASARIAAKEIGIHFSTISDVCKGRIKSARTKDKQVFQFRFGESTKSIGSVTYKGRME